MINKSKNKKLESEEIRKTILVIEDERPLVKVIQIKLEKSGFDVVTARTVEQGINYLEDIGSVDAVWLDHYLSGDQNGLDFVAKLKNNNSKWNKLPIFVVSNTASSTNLQSYNRLGVSTYSIKAESRLDTIVQEIKSSLNNPSNYAE